MENGLLPFLQYPIPEGLFSGTSLTWASSQPPKAEHPEVIEKTLLSMQIQQLPSLLISWLLPSSHVYLYSRISWLPTLEYIPRYSSSIKAFLFNTKNHGLMRMSYQVILYR